ncbi:TlpA family protein disulfide reductase [Promicromonospora iranensis]|uniref:Thiol-disulfide isomerase/thioredoxin n=1 Tax=Promicromonospora iranensis TaxID=1105144 RepID=A0ABU2CKI9_9MICO|nr:redoxin family protein [Promicromonospora iranensis]MDR7381850.1 thiol-disulfide isomerase/thioredoxin [Promicromonospora iranensis]
MIRRTVMQGRKALVVVVAAGSLLLAGCAAESDVPPASDLATAEPDTTEAPSTEPDPAESDATESEQADSALTFTATTVDGADFAAADLAGRPTVLWFWAPWCPTCVSQSPQVLDLAEEHGDAVNVVGVAGLDEPAAMADFIEMTDTDSLTHLNDEEGAVWRQFGITEQSTFAVLDKNGVVTHTGHLDPDELAGRVAELVG